MPHDPDRHVLLASVLRKLDAPQADSADIDGRYWNVDGIDIGGTVRHGAPTVDVSFPHPTLETPAYTIQASADDMERWLLAGLAAVWAARDHALQDRRVFPADGPEPPADVQWLEWTHPGKVQPRFVGRRNDGWVWVYSPGPEIHREYRECPWPPAGHYSFREVPDEELTR